MKVYNIRGEKSYLIQQGTFVRNFTYSIIFSKLAMKLVCVEKLNNINYSCLQILKHIEKTFVGDWITSLGKL